MSQKKIDSKKIRLLHLVSGLGLGGAEMLVFLYIQALGNKDYDHYVYFFGADGPIRKKIESLGVPVYKGKMLVSIKQPIRFGVCLISLVKDLLSFIERRRIQVIQSHLSYANQLALVVGKLSSIPAFPTVHNTKESIDRRSAWDLRVYLWKMLNAVIYRFADRVIAVSQEIKNIIIQKLYISNPNVLVVKNGIIFEDFVNKNTNKSDNILENEFLFSEKKLKLISVGRLTYQKNFEVLIRAVASSIDKGFDNLLVLIIGAGEERLKLVELIRKLDLTRYIKLLGIRHDVLELMKASDLFVMPSRYEGLSISMIEAMACGLPIIASDVSGIKNYITNGQNGILFPVNDHTSLAENIILLANDPNQRIKLSMGAKDTYKREYDLRQNIKPLDLLFREYASR